MLTSLHSQSISLAPRKGLAARFFSTRLGKALARALGRARARSVASWVHTQIPEGCTILDLGAGLGQVGHELRQLGHSVVTLDPSYDPVETGPHIRASAENLPVADGSFDVALLGFMLHHVPATLHRQMLAEAGRVARFGVLLLEDTFRTPAERLLTFFLDSLMNAEWIGHPHSNRTATGWVKLLEEAGLKADVRWERRVMALGCLPMLHALIFGTRVAHRE